MARSLKNKLVECISINLAKQKYGDPSKKDEFYIEAEYLLKDLLLRILIERSNGDPQEYVECLENVEELCGLDYYDVWFLESLVFGNWERHWSLSFFVKKLYPMVYI